MIFGAESEEEFNMASKSEWKCFCLKRDDTTVDGILAALREN